MKQKILVTGANGQLGKELDNISVSFPFFDLIFLDKKELDISNPALIREVFHKRHPQYCINCAAYTAVDKAESEKELAWNINAIGVGELAKACREFNTRLIHISTDYVFDGKASHPYKTDSQTNPQNVYGASKLEGEKLALLYEPSSLIIRTSWLYSEFGRNFVKTMLRLTKEKEAVNVVNDQFGSPTYARDLAEAIMRIISSQQWEPGIYHFSNDGVISWYDLAVAIVQMTGSSCTINAIPSADFPTPAKRPAYSGLDTKKISDVFGIQIKPWKESLEVCLSRLS